MVYSNVCKGVTALVVLGLSAATANAQDLSLDELRQQIERISAENQELQEKVDSIAPEMDADGISLGGAVRWQYVWTDYGEGNKDRGGDIDFDIFRLDLDGKMGDVILSAQYRWFEYMEALRHAYAGYNFGEDWQAQVGIVIQPFGVMPYNSHNYFFSSNFYIGLEDNNGAGVRFTKRSDDWDLDFAYILNDELGGADGAVRNKTARYNYDVTGIRLPGEGVYDAPTQLAAENNTLMVRAARKWDLGEDRMFELGGSLQAGDFHDGMNSVGDRRNYGIHAVYQTGPWEFHGQFATYDYDLDMANEGVIVAAYGYQDTIASSADSYTANVAYSKPVSIGPITNLTFYNNYSQITNKTGYEEDTVMNVLGVAVTSGGLYTYVDLVTAKNQPFIGGTMVGESDSYNTRFNINFGYYF
ncbi:MULTISPECIES: carbohydrate porin [Gammaproteobacteria]|uniref:carbohydrate porin n=1 Tax=Gammaproteobacteria TaxID=1236 RepID=UPI001A9FF1BB|nr:MULTISPECIES: carbohydrate porin [Gammaproteobacteria]